jgi:hypothetical protein
MDKKTHGKIINALRKLTFAYSPRNVVKKRQKVAPATYTCEQCSQVVYEGKKDLEDTGLLEKYPDVIKGKIHLDHINPVIPIEGFAETKWDWNEYIDNMFCGEEGLQAICKVCHDAKTKEENELRRKHKNNK